jgi:hypothetical protein
MIINHEVVSIVDGGRNKLFLHRKVSASTALVKFAANGSMPVQR